MTIIENVLRNGVDTTTLFATLDAVKGDPDLATFHFRATNRWLNGYLLHAPAGCLTAGIANIAAAPRGHPHRGLLDRGRRRRPARHPRTGGSA